MNYEIKNTVYTHTIKFASTNKDPIDKWDTILINYFSGGGVVYCNKNTALTKTKSLSFYKKEQQETIQQMS
jgi:hypothetical protein